MDLLNKPSAAEFATVRPLAGVYHAVNFQRARSSEGCKSDNRMSEGAGEGRIDSPLPHTLHACGR